MLGVSSERRIQAARNEVAFAREWRALCARGAAAAACCIDDDVTAEGTVTSPAAQRLRRRRWLHRRLATGLLSARRSVQTRTRSRLCALGTACGRRLAACRRHTRFRV
jgi:hypothetical protein